MAVQRPSRDRRRHPRAAADGPLAIRLGSDEKSAADGAGREPARVRDVSRGGVSFFLDRPLPLMAVVDVDLQLPGEDGARRVTGRGAVVRCERISPTVEHYEVAVFLHDMLERDREVLEAYVGTRDAV